jgi:hypothetical protein
VSAGGRRNVRIRKVTHARRAMSLVTRCRMPFVLKTKHAEGVPNAFKTSREVDCMACIAAGPPG